MFKHPSREAVIQGPDGEQQVLRKTRHGWQVRRGQSTIPLVLNSVVGPLVGSRIREVRQRQGLSLAMLAKRAGLSAPALKSRMWEIENSLRKEGIRLGTLYALAAALETPVHELLPTYEEVLHAAGIGMKTSKLTSLQQVRPPAVAHHGA